MNFKFRRGGSLHRYNHFVSFFFMVSPYKTGFNVHTESHKSFLPAQLNRMTISLCVKIMHLRIFLWGVMNFFQSHSKGLYKDPNDCMNHLVWDIFGTIRPLKIIFWDYILGTSRWKWVKIRSLTYFDFVKAFTTFVVRNEESRCLRSEYITIIIS